MAWLGLSRQLGEELGALQEVPDKEVAAVEMGLLFSSSSSTKRRDADRARYRPRKRKRLSEAERKRRRRESEKRWLDKNREYVRARARAYKREWNKRNKAKLQEYHRRMWADPEKRAKKMAYNTARQKERRAGKKR